MGEPRGAPRARPGAAPSRPQRAPSAPRAEAEAEPAKDKDADEAEPAAAESNGATEAKADRDDAKDTDGDAPKTTKLFVNRGERSGIEEEDLRWALREGAVLPDEAVHDVRVLHRFSFVEVDPDQAERTVEYLDGTKLKGKEIRLEVAKS